MTSLYLRWAKSIRLTMILIRQTKRDSSPTVFLYSRIPYEVPFSLSSSSFLSVPLLPNAPVFWGFNKERTTCDISILLHPFCCPLSFLVLKHQICPVSSFLNSSSLQSLQSGLCWLRSTSNWSRIVSWWEPRSFKSLGTMLSNLSGELK